MRRKISLSMSTMLRTDLSHLDTTSSPHGPLMSTRGFLVSRLRELRPRSQPFSMSLIFQLPLTGDPRVPLTQSRIKVLVVLAGLSQLLALSRELISSSLVLLFHSLSSNSLTVIQLIRDAMVDGNLVPSTIWRRTLRILRLIIHILLQCQVLASLLSILALSRSRTTLPYQRTPSLS
jgi:hypothetical protein